MNMDGSRGCAGSKDEQLYMLELLVDKLNLSRDKAKKVGNSPLCVRLRFISFPSFEVSQDEFASGKKKRGKEVAVSPDGKLSANGSVDFSAGKSCLFTKQPRDLVRAMQSQPLEVGVHKVSKKIPCVESDEDRPICKTLVPLSGCLCDQVSMAMNNADRLPQPYTLKNTYNLIDEEGKPSGTVAIFLRLSCFGKSIVTHFAFQERSFLFKSSRFGDEFQCSKVPPDEDSPNREASENRDKICVPDGYKEPEMVNWLPKPQDVIGLAPICQDLAKRDGGPTRLRGPLTPPLPSPKISMNDPGFDALTSAEKLNDPDYRGLVYKTYPNEPTCACSSGRNYLKALTGQAPCTGGACGGSSCAGTTRVDPPPRDHHGGGQRSACYTGNCCSGGPRSEGGCFGGPRMRGGGSRDENSGSGCGSGVRIRDANYTGISANNPMYPRGTGGSSAIPELAMDAPLPGACRVPSRVGNAGKRAGCSFEAKTGVEDMSSTRSVTGKPGAACNKKARLGVDGLLRAFKETQDFVDSIGKVPGLAGLGLPDPSESPYFGRERDSQENSSAPKRAPGLVPASNAINPSCVGPCNTQIPLRPPIIGTGLAVTAPPVVPFTIGVPRRVGVVREAIPALPVPGSATYPKTKRRDDKSEKQKESADQNPQPSSNIEIGPCGEPSCKSRRRTKSHREDFIRSNSQLRLSIIKKPPAQPKVAHNGGRIRGGGSPKYKLDGAKSNVAKSKSQPRYGTVAPGPGGDRNTNHKNCVKVSKRIMKFVYTAGTEYPGFNYGHKNCLDHRMRVPANMGWLWNTSEVVGRLKPRLGWRPGAISRVVNELLREAKKETGSQESRPTSSSSKGNKRSKVTKSKSSPTVQKTYSGKRKETENEEVELPPTLHIHRRDGTYYVTMYPIKQETMDVPQLQEPMKPLQFKITKNKDDTSIASSSTASDMEIEFSPPAAVNRYRKKPNVIHVDTQVKQQQILDAFKPPASKKAKKTKGEAKATKKTKRK